MRYVIVTYGTADGKHTRTVDLQIYETREQADEEIADCAEIGDEAARNGRMKVEEVEE